MPRKSKDELIEEARELGVEFDPEENYDDIFARVAEGREKREEAAEVLAPDAPLDPESDERTTSGWNSLGQWVGVKR